MTPSEILSARVKAHAEVRRKIADATCAAIGLTRTRESSIVLTKLDEARLWAAEARDAELSAIRRELKITDAVWSEFVGGDA